MPVPVPRQRAIPAAAGGQAQAAPTKPSAEPTTRTTAHADDYNTAPGAPSADSAHHDEQTDEQPKPTATTTAQAQAPATRTTATATTTATAAAPDPDQSDCSPHPKPGGSPTSGLTLLVIEDDPAGSLSIPEMQDAAGKPVRVRTARNLTEAERLLTDDVNCILLDLALPGTSTRQPRHNQGQHQAQAQDDQAAATRDELETLRHVLRLAPRQAVLALTDSGDDERGAEAVRVGAQDYLFRDELDARLLGRAVRYAVERKRADVAQRKLTESRIRAQENARLERGLLPTPLLDGSPLRFAARYRPGRSRALLGGDFYDVVRTPDGTVHAMIGDVCGHGPDEAALGVELRIAWRALIFAGLCGDELLSTLQQVLEHERENDEIFATLCTVDISPDGRRAGLCLAGHPSPLISSPGRPAALLPYENSGPALGLLPRARWPRMQVELGPSWSLMLYTDGLIEGRIGEGNQRLGQEGMVELIRRSRAAGLDGEELLEAAVNEVRDLNGGDLTDDVAVLLLDR
jgi:serine phosphatase RsbU (regulator of sigma subunit)